MHPVLVRIDACHGFAPYTKNAWPGIIDGAIHHGLCLDGGTFGRYRADVQEKLVLLPRIPHRVDQGGTIRLRHPEAHEAWGGQKVIDSRTWRWGSARNRHNLHVCSSPRTKYGSFNDYLRPWSPTT